MQGNNRMEKLLIPHSYVFFLDVESWKTEWPYQWQRL